MKLGGIFLLSLTILATSTLSFSSVVFAVGPAGVEDGLKFWFSADSGAKDSGNNAAADSEQVETWEDQSSDNRDATRSAGSAIYSENGLNFNPTLNFTDGRYQASDTGLVTGSGDRSIFVVASADSGGWRYVLGAGTFGSGQGFDFGHNSNNGAVFITTHSSQEASTGSWTPYGSARLAYGAVNSGPLYIAVNGSAPTQGSGGSVNTTLSGSVKIGSNSRGDEYWDGNISEIIYYNRLVTSTERQRINSYLALKYGFSLDQTTPQSYLASGSNLMWDKDASGASTYDNDLFGIGRDDASNLSQIKSRGQNSTTVITVEAVGEGTNLEPDFEDIDDLEFLVFGDNGGAASWTGTGAPAGYQILERQWKKQEQGNVGFVNMDFDVANSNMNIPVTLDGGVYYFVYDSDNDNSLADEVPQGMSDQGSDNWRVTVDFGSGGLFTLATTEGPAAESLSPVDNAVGVNGNTNLVITFSSAVSVDSGNILIKKSSDDSTVETIAVGGGQVTGSGTDIITINPTNDLAGGVEYYVQIPNTAFKDGDDDYFPGVTNTTGWSFTTGDFSGPDISDVEVTGITSSSSTITWTTNENASSKVVYGLTTAYGSSTSETDTSPRVTSHSVGILSLSSCTTYHFRVVSRDASSNSATSSDATFTTIGCPETEQGGASNGVRISMTQPSHSEERETSDSDEIHIYDDSISSTTTICSQYIKTYIRLGGDNDSDDVKKLEVFLNEKQGESLVVDGVYSDADVEAVKRFQRKYQSEILGVWGINEPTGYVYRTTLMKINSFYCNAALSCPVFDEFNSLTENPVSEEVRRTKQLLAELGFYEGLVDVNFDTSLKTSIQSFQEAFSETMLKPWGLSYGTGYKYKTTNKFLNMIVGCETPAIELDGRGTFDY